MTRRRVLFVDDEPRVLRGLRRLLDPMRDEWEISFAESGAEALDKLSEAEFDAVVTDMRMPGMDGAELLHEVLRRHPHTVRIVLSGQSDQETRLRAAGPTHQFLTKPCDEETLRRTLTRACDLRDLLRRDSLRRLVGQLKTLPSLGTVQRDLRTELMSPDPSMRKVGDLISQDVAMTAKVLQLVNSSFFGAPKRVGSVSEAVLMLGLNVIRDLMLTESVFGAYMADGALELVEPIRDHSDFVGGLAYEIAAAEGADLQVRGDAQLAGQLHDAGALVLAANMPMEFRKAAAVARMRNIERWQGEVELFGADHGEVGAYLLGIWGIPDPIVEAVAFHHRPAQAPTHGFTPLTAVHVADALAHEVDGQDDSVLVTSVDEEYLERLGLLDRLDGWRLLALKRKAA
ncbi:MAG: response regulator [Dehalococcoidia bacterium]